MTERRDMAENTKNKNIFDTTASKFSAQIYLNKIKEFSENALARDGFSADIGVEKTMFFIKQILQADCVLLGEIVNVDEDGVVRGIAGDRAINESVTGLSGKVLTGLSQETMVFTGDDEGAREQASMLLDGYMVMSGVSVPICAEDHPIGMLAIYYQHEVAISESRVLFLQSMSNVISHLLQSRDLLSQINIKKARYVIDAKREWEGTVDTLRQLVIVLDENSRIIRVNRTIEFWDMGSVESQIGKHAETIVLALTGHPVTEIYPNWKELWQNLSDYQHIEWEAQDICKERNLRLSLRTINKELQDEKHQGYAVLFVEDITQSKLAEEKLTKYTHHLEGKIEQRNKQLEILNQQLSKELAEHKKNKSALLKSEEKYARLFQSSLSGICQLHAGRIQFYNDRFFEVFKYPREHLNNMAFISLFHEDDRPSVMSIFAGADIPKAPQKHVIARAMDAAGNLLWLEVSLNYLKFNHDKTAIVNIIDLTRQKNIELSLRNSEERLQKLSRQLLNAQECERKRLALELHDGLGQSLSTIKYSIEQLRMKNYCETNSECKDILDPVVEYIQRTINDTRRMAMDLRPSILDDLGILSTINWFCRQYEETYKNISIDKQIMLEESDIVDSRKIVIYRIIQEALNNIAKHSGADTVCIMLRKIDENFIQLLIADNGCGMSNDGASITTGLSGMKERVELTGGTFMLTNNEPKGVKIDIRWPSGSAALVGQD